MPVKPRAAPLTPDDHTLLHLLAAYAKPFDASKIHGWVQNDAALFDAVRFLQIRPNKQDERIGLRRLNETTLKRIGRWFNHIEGRNISGLTLSRDCFGWCRVITSRAGCDLPCCRVGEFSKS
jgi:hypothetical protein